MHRAVSSWSSRQASPRNLSTGWPLFDSRFSLIAHGICNVRTRRLELPNFSFFCATLPRPVFLQRLLQAAAASNTSVSQPLAGQADCLSWCTIGIGLLLLATAATVLSLAPAARLTHGSLLAPLVITKNQVFRTNALPQASMMRRTGLRLPKPPMVSSHTAFGILTA